MAIVSQVPTKIPDVWIIFFFACLTNELHSFSIPHPPPSSSYPHWLSNRGWHQMFNVCVSQMVFISLLVGIGDLFMQLKIDNYAISCCDSETRTDPLQLFPDQLQKASRFYPNCSQKDMHPLPLHSYQRLWLCKKRIALKQLNSTHLSQIDGQIHFIVPHASR